MESQKVGKVQLLRVSFILSYPDENNFDVDQEKSFDIFYMNSEKGALGMAIHEMIHFVWFYVWNELFHDSYGEYETPSLKWILSEMVVESIMKIVILIV